MKMNHTKKSMISGTPKILQIFQCFQASVIQARKMADILKEIIKVLPEGKIDDAAFEAANIVLYTKDKEYFLIATSE